MPKSTRKRRAGKAGKTLPDGFPLWKHPSGRWCKKVRGRAHYFGRIDRDPDGAQALDEWLRVKDDLLAGRTPRPKSDGLTVKALVNRFLTEKLVLVDNGELSRRGWEDYHRTCERLVAVFGRTRLVTDLAADDFSRLRRDFSKTHGSWAIARDITHTRTLFKFAFDSGLIDKPVRYGPGFKRPPARKFRSERADKGARMFEAVEVRTLLAAAGQPAKAMILLGLNAALGNADVGALEWRHLDLDGGWLDFPRVKTGIERRIPLWAETVASLRECLELRPEPKDKAHDGLVFVTQKGNPWIDRPSAKNPTRKFGDVEIPKLQGDRPVTKEFNKLLKRPRCPKCGKLEAPAADKCGGCKWEPQAGEKWSKLHRRGLGFYGLRHTFQTVGDETGDFVAVRKIMGHTFGGDISDVYRERVGDARLRKVTDHVRGWLFGGNTLGKAG